MREKVYLVVSGSDGEDYSIAAVFANEADADEFKERLNKRDGAWNGYRVEEWPVLTERFPNTTWYLVWTDSNGQEIRRETRVLSYVRPESEETCNRTPNGGMVAMSQQGYDEALKIAQEKLAERKRRIGHGERGGVSNG